LGSRREYKVNLMCRGCGQAWTAKLNSEQDRYPQKCPKCGKAEGWPQYHCYNPKCNSDFAPEPVGNPPHMPIAPACPKCGSQQCGAVPVKP